MATASEASIPLHTSELVPRDQVILLPGTGAIVHPLTLIEIEHRHDLAAWTAAALQWITARAELQAAAAFTRIDAMYADGPTTRWTALDVRRYTRAAMALEHLVDVLSVTARSAERMVQETALIGAAELSREAACQDCREGKHGACIGSAFVENGPDIDEVACACTADGHRGRS